MEGYNDFDLLLLRVICERRKYGEIEKALDIVESEVDKEILRELKKLSVGKEGAVEVVVSLLRTKKEHELRVNKIDWERRLNEVLQCELSEGDKGAVLVEADKRWKKKKFLSIVEECEKGLKGDVNVVRKIEDLVCLIKLGFKESEEGDYRSVFDSVFLRLWEDREEDTLLTGIKILDSVMTGLRRGTLSVVLAPTSMGKTSFMIYLTGIAVLQNYSVLYITLEDVREVIERKILNFLLGDLTQERIQEKVEMLRNLGSSVYVRYLTGAGVRDVVRLLDEYNEKKGKIDVVVVDYGDLLMSGGRDEEFVELGKIFQQLLKLAVDRNIWVISGSQAVRSAVKSKVLGLDHVSRSFRKVEVAHYVFGLLQSKEEQEKGQLRLSVLKNKFGVKGMTVSLQVDWKRCVFKEVGE